MEQLDRYRKIVQTVIMDYARWKPANAQVESEAIVDRERDHYLVMDVGWEGRNRRIHFTVIHLDIINGKIWVQRDGTNRPVVDELLAAGVPREDIVIAFHPPDLRHHTEFAVG